MKLLRLRNVSLCFVHVSNKENDIPKAAEHLCLFGLGSWPFSLYFLNKIAFACLIGHTGI